MRLGLGCCLVVFLFLVARSAAAQEMFIYPNEGQSQDQMEKDKFDCYGWAKSSTGFDPMAPPPIPGRRSMPLHRCRRCGGSIPDGDRLVLLRAVDGELRVFAREPRGQPPPA